LAQLVKKTSRRFHSSSLRQEHKDETDPEKKRPGACGLLEGKFPGRAAGGELKHLNILGEFPAAGKSASLEDLCGASIKEA